jgi:hypothetical protein
MRNAPVDQQNSKYGGGAAAFPNCGDRSHSVSGLQHKSPWGWRVQPNTSELRRTWNRGYVASKVEGESIALLVLKYKILVDTNPFLASIVPFSTIRGGWGALSLFFLASGMSSQCPTKPTQGPAFKVKRSPNTTKSDCVSKIQNPPPYQKPISCLPLYRSLPSG